jgi:hypothetical protein
MVKRLSLCNMTAAINPAQFAAICELTSLEELSISGSWDEDFGAVCAISIPMYIDK